MRFLLYQILAVGVIWTGILFFYDELYNSGRIIFYVVTSWLLFLIVLAIKQFTRSRQEKTKK